MGADSLMTGVVKDKKKQKKRFRTYFCLLCFLRKERYLSKLCPLRRRTYKCLSFSRNIR